MKFFTLFIGLFLLVSSALGQRVTTFTGTAVIYGSGLNTRTVTRPFTLRLSDVTSDDETNRLVNTLQERGQQGLLNTLDDRRVGNFSLGGRVGTPVNLAHVENIGGQRRLRVVFARWIGFGEIRGGYRSVDYPFSYVEITVDPRTGRGDGTFIPAARIRYRVRDGEPTVEIEDFGTFPGRLLGVRMQGQLPG
jgi:hypothetical protein